MQTIKTEHGTYTISDKRDAGEFLRLLAKPKKRARREKDPARVFPRFWPGKTTTHGYILEYYRANGFDTTYLTRFKTLPSEPSPSYDPATPLCEVENV